jgi:outer membrane murein-binding lipoprotein Lpp
MKKAIPIVMILLPMLFLLTSCGGGVSQEEYDRVSSDLAEAQAQIQSLQNDLAAAQEQNQSLPSDLAQAQAQIQSLQNTIEAADQKSAEALAYTEFLDILMYPAYKDVGITPRFDFEDEVEWLVGLKNKATDIGDTKLSNYIKELEKGDESAMYDMWDYCLETIENLLK